MVFALRFRFVLPLCLGLLFAFAPSAPALQIGETHEQVTARHGPPNDEDHARNVATYFWDGWSAQLEFRNGTVNRITYKRDWYLQEGEIAALLAANGGVGRWTQLTAPGDKTRLWARDDGAAASCMAVHPLNMVFELGANSAGPPAAAKDTAPAAIPNSDATPAADTSEKPAPPAEPVPAPAPPPVAHPAAAPAALPAAAVPVRHGWTYALVAGAFLALGGTALYSFTRRPRRIGVRPTAAL